MSNLLEYFRAKEQQFTSEKVYRTRCPYCSVQCSMELIDERIIERKRVKVNPIKTDPTSEGRLCVKGMQAHQHVLNPYRITYPMVKVDGDFEPVSWQFALDYIKGKFMEIQTEHGHDALAVYGGGSLTNEEAYLLGKFARVGLQTKYIDYNGRYCMSAAATAGMQVFGIDRGLTCELSDIPLAKCIIIAGTNIAECQPTIWPYFRKAKKNGAFIIAIDPRETMTTKLADLHLQVKPGMDANLVSAMLKILVDGNDVNHSFVANRTKGFSELAAFLQTVNIDSVADVTGVAKVDIMTAADKFGKAETGIVFTARGVEQHASGVETVKNFINLVLLTGKIGKAGSGYGAITGQGNGQGGREHGMKADQLPGYRSIENKEHRSYIADVWGIAEEDLPGKGVSAYEMIGKINEGEIKGLFLMGSNPVVSSPNAQFVKKALEKLDVLVAVDMYMSETARLADVILPTTAYLEDTGTMTNLEGRVVFREGTRQKPGETKHDWEIICEIAKVLGKEQFFTYPSVAAIFDELRIASRGGIADYHGMTYERIKEEQGLFWPCPEVGHPGERRLFTHAFAHEDKKAVISIVDVQNPNELPCQDFPLILTTGRVMHHYLSGTQTRHSSKLVAAASEPLLEIHPDTASKMAITDGKMVMLKSRRGNMVLRAKYSSVIRQDTVFTAFHWGDLQSVNRLTNPALDPTCKMPEFKACTVKVEPL